jgi:hypothetical protein
MWGRVAVQSIHGNSEGTGEWRVEVVRYLPGAIISLNFLFVLHFFFVVGVAGCGCGFRGVRRLSYFPAFFMFFEVGEFAVVDLCIAHYIYPILLPRHSQIRIDWPSRNRCPVFTK